MLKSYKINRRLKVPVMTFYQGNYKISSEMKQSKNFAFS